MIEQHTKGHHFNTEVVALCLAGKAGDTITVVIISELPFLFPMMWLSDGRERARSGFPQ